MAGMVLVNLPGSWSQLYPPLRHASWHGWTPTDFVFPFFLFAIGLSIPFSFAKRLASSTKGALAQHILKRSALLFLIGLGLNGFPYFPLGTMRIPGVLQRIALAYLLGGLMILFLNKRTLFISSILILLGYWASMTLFPIPGGHVSQLTPTGNFGAWLDRWLLAGHLYKPMWDPEGLWGTLPSIVNIVAGYYAGKLIRDTKNPADTTGQFFVLGWMLLMAGLVWGIWFPINKKLWTSSYVLFSSGAALQLLGVCYWLTDVKKKDKWLAPALIFGSNPIALYVLHILYIKVIRMLIRFPLGNGKSISLYHWMYLNWFASWAGKRNGSLAFAVCHVLIWFGVMWWMKKNKLQFSL